MTTLGIEQIEVFKAAIVALHRNVYFHEFCEICGIPADPSNPQAISLWMTWHKLRESLEKFDAATLVKLVNAAQQATQ